MRITPTRRDLLLCCLDRLPAPYCPILRSMAGRVGSPIRLAPSRQSVLVERPDPASARDPAPASTAPRSSLLTALLSGHQVMINGYALCPLPPSFAARNRGPLSGAPTAKSAAAAVRRAARDHNSNSINRPAERDWLAGRVGGGADRDDLVAGGGIERLPVRGHRDGGTGSDADRLAGGVGGGVDRDDRVRAASVAGDVGGLPVRGDRDFIGGGIRKGDADWLSGRIGGRIDGSDFGAGGPPVT